MFQAFLDLLTKNGKKDMIGKSKTIPLHTCFEKDSFFMKIHNIILDLGGVVLNIDYNRTIEAFRQLGIENAAELYTQQAQFSLFDDLETGKISAVEFYDAFRKLTKKDLSDSAIQKAWNAMLLDFPKKRLETLQALSQQYRLFLLSNTNAIHYEAYTKTLRDTFGINNLSSFFEKEYYSHEIGVRKPHAEAFRLILSEQNIKAEETLFVDDSKQHIEGAERQGLKTYLLSNETLEAFVKRWNLL